MLTFPLFLLVRWPRWTTDGAIIAEHIGSNVGYTMLHGQQCCTIATHLDSALPLLPKPPRKHAPHPSTSIVVPLHHVRRHHLSVHGELTVKRTTVSDYKTATSLRGDTRIHYNMHSAQEMSKGMIDARRFIHRLQQQGFLSEK